MRESMACERRSQSAPAAQTKPVVFVVDDDVSVREALQGLVINAGWDAQVFESARDFLAHPRVSVPSCLVLDVSLPDLNGLDLQRTLAANRAAMPIIFISGYGDVPMTVRAMKAGAVEFLTKPVGNDTLLSAIGSALERSQNILGDEVELQVVRDRYALLSHREREVMGLIVSGLLNKQVGGELGISVITVKAHRGKVMRKMGARSFAELIGQATRIGVAGHP